jgi:hypothetical protein
LSPWPYWFSGSSPAPGVPGANGIFLQVENVNEGANFSMLYEPALEGMRRSVLAGT